MRPLFYLVCFTFLFVFLPLFYSCDTEVNPKYLPVVETSEISVLTEASAISGGNITSDGGNEVIARGVCWGVNPNPTISDSITKDAAGTGRFISKISRLVPNTTYYLRAYATNKKGTSYGLQVTFTTKSLGIVTKQITDTTINSAKCGGVVSISGDSSNIIARGVCWNTETNPTILHSKTTDGKGIGEFNSSLAELAVNTTYYVRAYITNSGGTYYGNEMSFKTKDGLLKITTGTATSIKAVSATVSASITDDEGSPITERGFCISQLPNPTTDNKITNGSGKGSFATNFTGLTAGKTYYVRAYAINSVGTSYGNEVSFTTLDGVLNITTSNASSITTVSASVSGNIADDEGSPITERGFCISQLPNPTTDNKISNGSGKGTFTTNFTGLTAGKTYYVRAYAINSVGTSYGNEVSFSTLDGIVKMTTNVAASITATSATSGGNITNDGGASVTSRGICWSTNTNPTIDENKTVNGSGNGSYSANISGLIADKIYYVRAYAINTVGVSYGNEISFSTLDGVVKLTTSVLSESIFTISARAGGIISNDGGALVTARGVCWSTSPGPTITSAKTSDGSGTGSFSSTITGLTASTTYYVRAYATNSVGTSYGNEVSFKTNEPLAASIQTSLIPAGTFIMGSPGAEYDRVSNEDQYNVVLSSFQMSKFEITNFQFAYFLNDNNIGSDGIWSKGSLFTLQKLIYTNITMGLIFKDGKWVSVSGFENAPIVDVTWYGAYEFAAYLGGKLPTEAQWEYACRAGTITPFNTGLCLNNNDANYDWDYPYNTCSNVNTIEPGRTQAVGTYTANAFGLYDMHGNVWEWCYDWFGTYPTNTQTNPSGMTSGTSKVIRGGSWGTSSRKCRSAHRFIYDPINHMGDIGFRIVFIK